MNDQNDRRVPRGLGPEHDTPLLDQHAEAMFRYYHEPPTLAEHAEMVKLDPMAGVPLRGWPRVGLGRVPGWVTRRLGAAAPPPAGGQAVMDERLHAALVRFLAGPIAEPRALDDAQTDIETLLSVIDAAGYAVVPKEPNEAMLAEAKIRSAYLWRAMLTAAKEER